jgi:hypothetical protein
MMTAPLDPARELVAPFPGGTVGDAAQAFMNEGTQSLQVVSENSIYLNANSRYWIAIVQLSSLLNLRCNWDSYGAPAPNQVAVGNALRILSLMWSLGLQLTSVVPSAEGGVGFCFKSGNRYADIESSNEGEIIGVRYVGMEAPILIEANNSNESLTAALVQIKDHMDGRTPRPDENG